MSIKANIPKIQLNYSIIMSRVCELTGKKVITGNNVSFSNRKTKRKFYPNLQEKRFFIPETEKWVKMKISTSALRTINKLGISEAISKYKAKGTVSSKVLKSIS